MELPPETLRRSVFWQELARRAGPFHEACHERVEALAEALDDLGAQLAKRRAAFHIETLPGGMARFVDDSTGFRSQPAEPDAAELAMEIARGKALTELETKLRAEKELADLDADCVPPLREAVEHLAAAKALYAAS